MSKQDLENRLIKIESDDMQKQILACVVGVLFATAAYADETVKVKKLLPDDVGKVLVYKSADVNRDRRKDMVVITESKTADDKYGYRRILFIFLSDKKGGLNEVIRNDKIIACSKCSSFESEPDPFSGKRLSVSDGKISVVQNFDMRFYPSVAIYEFCYKPKIRTFQTVTATHALYEQEENGTYKLHVSNHITEFGKSLDLFNPEWHKLIGIQDKFY